MESKAAVEEAGDGRVVVVEADAEAEAGAEAVDGTEAEAGGVVEDGDSRR